MANRAEIARQETRRLRQVARAVMAGQVEVEDYRQIRAASIAACQGEVDETEAAVDRPAASARSGLGKGVMALVIALVLGAVAIGAAVFGLLPF